MEIARSFEYLLETFAKSTDTALSWLMPISLAYYVLQEDPDHARWVRKKMEGFEDIWAVLQNTNPDGVYWVEKRADRYDAFPSQFGTSFLQEFREPGWRLPVRPRGPTPEDDFGWTA
ncbi:hypothetical protein DIS24_g9553 [Lasiodiplodia hormozganensis]|uniref:Uncharacterized protein n=1 Tax=Lasiodiplodia hormozganensis TaxID=869390 RepID=A0AA40CKC7_9PEZI|nr:hypothetical protein DIS24_g9553 [Lasiodiplodia hormozganensis]